MTETPFDTFIKSGFENAANAFKANFADGLELGAQFCAYQNGALLLDLKGGWTDRQKQNPVDENSLFSVYSSGKAMAALAIAFLVDQDKIGYDQLITTFWPEFGQNGKETVTVGQVMSHQAGLPGISNPDWTAEDWYDWDKTCAELAKQKPLFQPGTACGYHPNTFGFLAGEIAKRVDGRSIGQILQEEFCRDNNIDVWIGLPESEHARCAAMVKPKSPPSLGEITPAKRFAFLSKGSSPRGNLSRWRQAEFAGSNCHATAKGMARMMQVVIDGKIDQTVILAEDVVEKLRLPRISGQNLILPFETTYAAGLLQNAPNFFYGPTPETLGHSGWGGSCVFADPITGIYGAYVMNVQNSDLLGDARPRRIIDALYECL